jgi:hypothetical protein
LVTADIDDDDDFIAKARAQAAKRKAAAREAATSEFRDRHLGLPVTYLLQPCICTLPPYSFVIRSLQSVFTYF